MHHVCLSLTLWGNNLEHSGQHTHNMPWWNSILSLHSVISKGQTTQNRRGSEFKGIIELDDEGEDLSEKEDMQGHYHKPKKRKQKYEWFFRNSWTGQYWSTGRRTEAKNTGSKIRPVSESQFYRILVLCSPHKLLFYALPSICKIMIIIII